MEYVWKCFDFEGVTKKAGNCKITIFIIYLASFLVLTLAVAVYSYAAESLTLEEAVERHSGTTPDSGFLMRRLHSIRTPSRWKDYNYRD